MKMLACTVASAALASASLAQTTSLTADLQVWDTGLNQWVDSYWTVPGQTASFRMMVSCSLSSGMPMGWAGLSLKQISIADWSSGDSLGNVTGKLMPSSQTFGLFPSGSSGALDRLDNQAASISLGQLPLNNGGDGSNPIEVFSFSYTFQPDLWWRTIVFSVPGADFVQASIYTTAAGSIEQVPSGARVFDGVTILLFPSPASIGLLGAGLILGASGRRRSG
jgi:hypothetical protein